MITDRPSPAGTILAAALAAALVFSPRGLTAQTAASSESRSFAPSGVVVWFPTQGDADAVALAACTEALADLRLAVVAEVLPSGTPDPARVAELLAIHRAVAAVWHDAGGRLNMALSAAGRGLETMQAAPGPPEAEAVFVREVLAARLEGGARPPIDLLVTVPAEPPRTLPAAPPRSAARALAEKPSAWSGWLGAGYRYRAHFDAAGWGQHEVVALVPGVRLEERWLLKLVLAADLPVRIGERDERMMELSSLSASAAIGFLPWTSRHLDVEACVSAGAERTAVTAFLGAGETARATSIAPLLMASLAMGWRASRNLRIRAHLDAAFAIEPTAYGIEGRGDFGGFPWQIGGGVDMEMSVLGQ
ncbi:MAG: hypothetical protein PHU25_05790 [Deltaproteobacteria bacterium]|nr:hypothetical protein [Deltaproteobacteria bacterium]